MFLEDKIQIEVAKYLDLLGVLWHHPANERKTSPQAGIRLKRKGVKSGVPDIMIFEPKKNFNGLAIELKAERDNGYKKNGEPRKKTKGVLSDNQKQWLADLKDRGWEAKVCYSTEEAIEVINKYFER